MRNIGISISTSVLLGSAMYAVVAVSSASYANPPMTQQPMMLSNNCPSGTTIISVPVGTLWTVPPCFNPSNNTIEAVGAGGKGGVALSTGNAGGSGGCYAKSTNVSLTPGASVGINVAATGDAYICNSTSNCASIAGSAVVVGAKAGNNGSGTGTTAACSTANSVGATKNAGGLAVAHREAVRAEAAEAAEAARRVRLGRARQVAQAQVSRPVAEVVAMGLARRRSLVVRHRAQPQVPPGRQMPARVLRVEVTTRAWHQPLHRHGI